MEGAWESGRQNHPIDSASLATSGPAPEPLLHLSLLFQFKRLQGKRNRGREEINFVEIKGDDQLSGAQQWMTKSLTEEKTMKSFSRVSGAGLLGSQCGRPRSPLALPPAAAPWQTPVVRWQCAPGSGTGSAVSPGRGRPAAEAGQQRSVPARGGSPSPPSREARTSLSTSLGCGRHGAAEVLGSRVLGVQPLRAIVPRSRRPRPQPCLLRARWRSSLHLAAEHSICGRYSLRQGEGGEPRTPAQQPPGRHRPPHCLLLAPFALLCSVATDGHLRPASGFNGVLAVMQDSSGLWLGQHGAVTVCWHSHSGGLTLPTGSRSIVAE